jgi:hypothetical protein
LWLRPVWTGDFVPLIYSSKMSPKRLRFGWEIN